MRVHYSDEEVRAVFLQMDLSLAERGMDEVQKAKDRALDEWFGRGNNDMVYMTHVSDSTARFEQGGKNAKLERCT